MRVKKTVTDKVITANRSNSQKSTGPTETGAGSQNARKHGVFAKNLTFHNPEEKTEFECLRDDLTEEYEPLGATERVLIEEASVCLWKLSVLDGWAMQELDNRRSSALEIVRSVAENYRDQQVPLFTQADGSQSAAGLGWDCQQLTIRTGSRKFEEARVDELADQKGKSGQVLIEARLTSAIDSIIRYQNSLKKDYYRAIAMLREIRRERREQNDAEFEE
jgi:hypothetical protein